MDKIEAFNGLDFGSVDSESEENLDEVFVQTEDFNRFLIEKNSLILGAKGSGKSALFRLFSKYEYTAR